MCPVTASTAALASLAISSVGAVTSFVGQMQAANAQAEHQANVMEQTQENARRSHLLEIDQINKRIEQERAAASQSLTENAVEAAKARSTARVSAGEAGVSGISVDALMADFNRQEAVYRHGVRENLLRTTDQLQLEKKASGARRQSRINSAFSSQRPVQRPSFLQPALAIGGAGVDYFRQTRNLKD